MDGTEMRWVYRPPQNRRSGNGVDGATVFGFSAADQDGLVDVILADGTRITAAATDVVAEPANTP